MPSQIPRLGTHPDIESLLDQHKRQRSLLVREAHPDLAVHQQAMVQVQDALLDTLWSAVDSCILLPFPPCQPMESEQVAILSLYDVFFGGVSERGAEVDKVGGVADRRRDGCASSQRRAPSLLFSHQRRLRQDAHFLLCSARFCAGVVSLLNRRLDMP